MGRVPFTQRRIDVYTCVNDPSRDAVAMIAGWPMVFKGKSVMRAKKAAEDWRRDAVRLDKLISKARKIELLGES